MASELDSEIEQLRDRAALLKKQLQLQTSTLLAAPSTRHLLREAHNHREGHRRDRDAAARTKLLDLCDAHAAHKQQCLYRAGAAATAFRVRDPDPNAVDGGRVLGVRIDVMMGAQFLRPYYVLLNRDGQGRGQGQGQSQSQGRGHRRALRVHRHTVPPCIPLAGLAARFLETTTDKQQQQPNLYGFVRALRRALVRYHNRLAVVGDLRRAVAARPASETTTGQDHNDHNDSARLVDVSGADADAKQIRLDWADQRTGRLVLDDDGGIEQLVVVGVAGGRDRAAARALLAGATTAQDLVRRLSGA